MAFSRPSPTDAEFLQGQQSRCRGGGSEDAIQARVNAGGLLHVTTELRELGRKSIHFTHRMYDSENGELVATTDLVGVYFDTAARKSIALPDSVHEAAKALMNTE